MYVKLKENEINICCTVYFCMLEQCSGRLFFGIWCV